VPWKKIAYNEIVKFSARLKLVLVVSLAVLLFHGANISYAQEGDFRIFPETGHRVSGEFLEFYNIVPNAEFYFGYPISREFTDSLTGRRTQYFQRVRFEYFPNEAELGTRVQLTDLGHFLYDETRGDDLAIGSNSPACQVYPSAFGREFQVCLAFLEFYQTNGEISQFGFPISNFRNEDGRIVQYFDRARFFWNPKGAPGQRVQLSDLGRIYFYQHLENPELLDPEKNNTIDNILELKTRAFTEKALLGSGESLTVYVIVQDQNLNPVETANVSISIKSGTDEPDEQFLLPPTDENGIAEQTFQVRTEAIGVVEIEATATYKDLRDTTVTSFRVWW
jgi:hypothetical protein